MNLLERAKVFVAAKAAKIALIVVPLAALTAIAVPAKAGAVAGVGFSPAACTVTTGSGTCAESQASATGGDSLANWVQLYSIGSLTPNGSGTLVVGVNGNAGGSFGGTQPAFPISWDFFINNSGHSVPNGFGVNAVNGTVHWDLLFQVLTSSGGIYGPISDPSGNDSSSGSTEIKGNTTFSIPFLGNPVTGYKIQLTTTDSVGDTYTVTIPGGATLDLNPLATTATPEPSSLPFAAFGLLGLLFRRRKKRS